MKELTWADLGQQFDGPHATPKRKTDGPYFLNISSLENGRLDLSKSDRLSEDEFVTWTRRVIPQSGDLLYSYETRLGEAALMPDGIKACLGRRMALLRPNPEVVDPKFLLYFYLGPQFQRTIQKHTITGATVPRLLLSEMPSWTVVIPPLEEQRGIAEVLGALDDKIAANTQSVNLALELADAEYSQRVRGATPGQTFGEVATVGGGGTPRTSNEDYWNGDVSWATPTDVTALSAPYLTTTARTVSEAGLANCSSALYPAGSILMTSRATIGAFALAQRPTAVNQGFIVVNAHDAALQMWLFHEMRARISEFISHANGATFLELSRGKFKAFTVRVAESQVMADFGVFAEALHEQAAALTAESDRLAATRDALLPLLMSGKVKVKDAESVVGEVL